MFRLSMRPQCLLHAFIGDAPSNNKELSSSHSKNIADCAMSVNNVSRFSHDLSLDEIPGFEVQQEPATPATSSEISGLSVDELIRAYTARLSEMEREMREVKEQLERTIVMSYVKKKHNSG